MSTITPRILLTILAAVVAGCSQPQPQIEWQSMPADVLVAGPAVAFKVAGRGKAKTLAIETRRLPADGQDLNRLALYRRAGGELQRTQFRIDNGQLIGDFSAGEEYVFMFPPTASIIAKHDLFCRIRAVQGRSLAFDTGFLRNRLCPVILCPNAPFRANDLLTQFNELGQFPNDFPDSDLAAMEIEPEPVLSGFGNICDQCFGVDFDTVLIPDCVIRGGGQACNRWQPRGPGPNTVGQVESITDREVVGAVNAVTPHPADADIVFVGSVNGGIWRTGNATDPDPTWVNQTDAKASLSIGALEYDPTDTSNQTLVAGIGRFSSLNRQGGDRTGLLRTTDETNWTAIDGGGTLRGLNISGVAPRGATIVVSANAADTFANRGVWRSTDTGATFTQISGATGSGLPTGAAFDLAGDPSDNTRLYTNSGAGIFRSDDTGATWTKISTATMDAAIGNNVEIAVGNNQNVFVALVRFNRLAGLFRSADSGATWTSLDLPQTTESGGATFGIHPGGQGGIHLSIAADPNDDNVVYVGGDRQPCFTENVGCNNPTVPLFPNSLGANDFSGRLFRVDASAASGSQVMPLTHNGTNGNSSPHADSRDMDFRADGVLLEADDGGIYARSSPRSNNGDWTSMNGNLQTTEFHNIAWDAVNELIIGGAQDTGTPQQFSPVSATWQSVSTADGGDVAVDDTSTPSMSIRYSSNQFLGGFRRRVYDSADVLQSQVFPNLAVQPPPPAGNPVQAQFYTPIELNNMDATRLIVGGGNSVYESLDQGNTVTEIGVGIVVNNLLGNDAIAYGANGNNDMLYVGSGAQVFIRNAAAPAALTASASYPGTANIVDIAIDTRDPNTAFVADNENVFFTTDGGATWTDITGNLGTFDTGTIRAIAFRPTTALGAGVDLVAIGTDTGVFGAEGATFDDWSAHGCNLPTVPIYDLDYDLTDRVFVAGTFGRGAWVLEE